MYTERDLEISRPTCEWTVRAISVLTKRFGINVKLHHSEGQIASGQIFLFNHFARFETFIPQYLIYQETGAYSRSVAGADLFVRDDAFSRYLRALGAVPNNHPKLFPFLAAEILRGRKVVIFPEGGMVKDRRVLDRKGRYRVYSRSAGERRKHHMGAAVLALTLDAFKEGVRAAHAAGDRPCLEAWAEDLDLEGVEALVAAARQPTLIVPSNITFYPIRIGDNILRKGVELFSKGIKPNLAEELRIEGNLLLKDTDMDLRLGDPMRTVEIWRWWERKCLLRLLRRIDSLDGLFALRPDAGRLDERLFAIWVRHRARRLRDAYMQAIYSEVTVNLSHLAALLIHRLLDRGRMAVDRDAFHKTLYRAIKNAQQEPSINLHRSLCNPARYSGLVDGQCAGFERLLRTMVESDLVEVDPDRYRFLPKLCEEHDFDEVRLENPVLVYANEVAPIAAARRAVERAMEETPALDQRSLARMIFDDELIAYRRNKAYFSKPRFDEISRKETATRSAEPYLLAPDEGRGLGVVLVHGFLASPAELRDFARKLEVAGYPVIGVRLAGHGTSPWDLRGREWTEWLEAVRRGYNIMSAFADRICLVGFSTGGALSLCLAAERPERVCGVAAVCAPLKFRNRNLVFAPLVHRANRIARWVSSLEGIVPFRPIRPEHPHINYRHVPIRGLYELSRMVAEFRNRLPEVRCPVTLVQSTQDPVVDPHSARLIYERLGSTEKSVHMVESQKHGIMNEDVGDTHATVLSFLAGLVGPKPEEWPQTDPVMARPEEAAAPAEGLV